MTDIAGDTYEGPERRGKAWWRSWTLWFNVVSAVFVVVEAHMSLLQSILSPAAFNVTGFVIAVVNALLRIKTTTAIALRDKPTARDGAA